MSKSGAGIKSSPVADLASRPAKASVEQLRGVVEQLRRCPLIGEYPAIVIDLQVQVREDLVDNFRIFDASNNPCGAATVLASCNVNVEYALEPLRPGHCRVLFRKSPLLSACCGALAALAASCGRDLCAVLAVWREDTMVAGQIDPGSRYERCQLRQEVQRLKDDMGSPIAVGGLQSVSNIPARCQCQTLFGQCAARRGDAGAG